MIFQNHHLRLLYILCKVYNKQVSNELQELLKVVSSENTSKQACMSTSTSTKVKRRQKRVNKKLQSRPEVAGTLELYHVSPP